MGTGYNSALYTALKRRRDLAHDVYAFNYTPRDRGVFLLGASCEPERAPEVLRGLMQQVYEPALALSDHELAAAKTRIVSHFVHARETYQGIADQLGRSALIYGDPNYGTHYVAAVEALRSRPRAGTATLTTVASRKAMPEPRTAMASTQRPAPLP